MAITQLSAFLANRPGTLSQAVGALSGAGINIRALSVAETSDFGILRIIVSDPQEARQILSPHTVVSETQVVAVRMADRAGALQHILTVLEAASINVEYVYAFPASGTDSALVVFRVNDIAKAEKVLTDNGETTLSDTDLSSLL
jgi:hypothetical protein